MFPVVFSGLQLSGWSATAKGDSPYLTEMWNAWAKERFLVLRTMSSRKGSFCDISLTQFQLASIFFFLLPLMATQLLAWDGNCFVAPVLLWNPSLRVEWPLHYCSGPEHQRLSLAFCSDCGFYKVKISLLSTWGSSSASLSQWLPRVAAQLCQLQFAPLSLHFFMSHRHESF